MLSPPPDAPGPLPRHTPLLVDGLRELGCEVRSEPWGSGAAGGSWRDRLLERPRDAWRARRMLGERPFDVLVVKTSHDGRALLRDLALLACVRRRVRTLVVQFHGGNSERLARRGNVLFKAASALLFRSADGILVLSQEEASLGRSFFPRGSFHVVLNPFLPPQDEPAATVATPEEPVVLFASRVLAPKGIFDTIDAVAELGERRPCRLVVAGDGSDLPAAIRRAAARGLDGKATFLGRRSTAELARLYAEATVFVLPTYWAEGFPTAITEAMNAGLPVITTRSRGMADHLEDGRNALFVPPRDPSALAAALERLFDDEQLRRSMAAANREKVEDFHPRNAARRYLEALREVAAR